MVEGSDASPGSALPCVPLLLCRLVRAVLQTEMEWNRDTDKQRQRQIQPNDLDILPAHVSSHSQLAPCPPCTHARKGTPSILFIAHGDKAGHSTQLGQARHGSGPSSVRACCKGAPGAGASPGLTVIVHLGWSNSVPLLKSQSCLRKLRPAAYSFFSPASTA